MDLIYLVTILECNVKSSPALILQILKDDQQTNKTKQKGKQQLCFSPVDKNNILGSEVVPRAMIVSWLDIVVIVT